MIPSYMYINIEFSVDTEKKNWTMLNWENIFFFLLVVVIFLYLKKEN